MPVRRHHVAIAGLTLTLLGMLILEVGLWLFLLPTTLAQRAATLGSGAVLVLLGVVGMACGRAPAK